MEARSVTRPSLADLGLEWAVRELERHGFILVHPDDVPERVSDCRDPWSLQWFHGYNACRRQIFGEGA